MDVISDTPTKITLQPPTAGFLRLLRHSRWVNTCARFCQELGFRVEVKEDGPLHLILYSPGEEQPVGYAICLSHMGRLVRHRMIQRLWDNMDRDKVSSGIIFSLDEFSDEAKDLVEGSEIELIGPRLFMEELEQLPERALQNVLKVMYWVAILAPFCPLCSEIMYEVNNGIGSIWRCYNYPKCRMTYMP